MTEQIFCVQDRTGTVAQLTIAAPPTTPVAVGDTGDYTGILVESGASVTLKFTVGQVLNPTNFGITTALPNGTGPGDILQSGWPPSGSITWLTGPNATATSTVEQMVPANAYISTKAYMQYHLSRGNLVTDSPVDPLQMAIVQATDYLNQKYRYKGVKLLQFLGQANLDPMLPFIDPWLTPFGFTSISVFAPSTTQQQTEFPRQGVTDYNGDSIYGIPLQIEYAAAELAFRVMNGTVLQPDYDPAFVGAGGIYSSVSKEVGPIKKTVTIDTKLGIGFFPDFPHITRMLNRAGLLLAGGGRSIVR